ncbi:MAG TPA: helix-turn-helix domain-containing protein [Gammaproteobacteria bacterium]|nr:helix-turn-helix domain-containing protein [Gammaproteobacteria bacterium]
MNNPRTLSLIETAKFLGIHKQTARNLAAAGHIPGAKVGRSWRFLQADLETYFRSLYSSNASQGVVNHRSKTTWHSTNVTVFGGLTSPTKAEEYEKVLGLR